MVVKLVGRLPASMRWCALEGHMTQTPFMKSLIVNLQEVNTHSDALIPMEMDGMEDMYT
jgi:hypothetical protein